jgi:hypothetical protein
MEIKRRDGLGDIAALGLTLSEAKPLLANVQREIAAAQARDHVVRRPDCPHCNGVCRVKDYRDHAVATLFGQGHDDIASVSLCQVWRDRDRHRPAITLPIDTETGSASGAAFGPDDRPDGCSAAGAVVSGRRRNRPGDIARRHTIRAGEALAERTAIRPETATPVIAVTLDTTFVRSCEDGERHLEVRIGNVETKSSGRQVFGAVATADTDITVLIRRNLDAAGRTDRIARSPSHHLGSCGPPCTRWMAI